MRDAVDEFSDAESWCGTAWERESRIGDAESRGETGVESAGPDVLAAADKLNESIGEPSFAEHLANLLDAVESLLETWRYPEKMDAGDPVCYVHPDAMVALEEAYDQYLDAALAATGNVLPG